MGGGHAQLTGPLAAAGHEPTVYGSHDRCGARVQPWVTRGQARFAAGDLLHAPWPDRAFDVVLCYRLLPHVADWPALVAELCRLAGAAVLVDYPTRRSVNALADRLFGLKRRLEGDTRPFRVFDDAVLESAFARHGLAPVRRRPQFFLPMALHRGLRLPGLSRALEAGADAVGLTRRWGSPVILRLERRG